MAKITVSEFVSLDGVIEGPGPADSYQHAGWTMPFASDQVMKFKFDELMASDALLLGRMTYDGFAAAWPGMQDGAGFADKMNAMPKYIASTTLTDATWNNSHLISNDIVEEVKKLKQASSGAILVNGSFQLIETLLAHALIDELVLLIYPIVLGSGKHLFGEHTLKTSLTLTHSETFDNGVVSVQYKVTA